VKGGKVSSLDSCESPSYLFCMHMIYPMDVGKMYESHLAVVFVTAMRWSGESGIEHEGNADVCL
jgi:hypothetical protein